MPESFPDCPSTPEAPVPGSWARWPSQRPPNAATIKSVIGREIEIDREIRLICDIEARWERTECTRRVRNAANDVGDWKTHLDKIENQSGAHHPQTSDEEGYEDLDSDRQVRFKRFVLVGHAVDLALGDDIRQSTAIDTLVKHGYLEAILVASTGGRVGRSRLSIAGGGDGGSSSGRRDVLRLGGSSRAAIGRCHSVGVLLLRKQGLLTLFTVDRKKIPTVWVWKRCQESSLLTLPSQCMIDSKNIAIHRDTLKRNWKLSFRGLRKGNEMLHCDVKCDVKSMHP